MRTRIAVLLLVLALAAAGAAAQKRGAGAPTSPNHADMYCSGAVTNEAISNDTYIISGEESHQQITFSAHHELVYVNKGSSHGVKAGDEFLVMRPIRDSMKYVWFAYQTNLRRAMGTQWTDAGRVRVVAVQPEVSIAQVVFSCGPIFRGDVALRASERPAPKFKETPFDEFAAVNGKPLAMLVASKNYESALVGQNDVVYVNLGSSQGVKAGDYFRIFRYQGQRHEAAYQVRGHHRAMFGFGATPRGTIWTWDNLPREILGEGIVLRVSENASTVMITFSKREMYLGDYVEVQ